MSTDIFLNKLKHVKTNLWLVYFWEDHIPVPLSLQRSHPTLVGCVVRRHCADHILRPLYLQRALPLV